MVAIKNIVDRFELYKQQFEDQIERFDKQHHIDLFFEFKAFMIDEIELAKDEMSDEIGFNNDGDETFLEGVTSMVNQVKAIMCYVDMACACYQHNQQSESSDLRKCPHCGEIWEKLDDDEDDDEIWCGGSPRNSDEIKTPGCAVMSVFTFHTTNENILTITETETGCKTSTSNIMQIGCGKPITWSNMKKVPLPPEFNVSTNNTPEDVSEVRKVIMFFFALFNYRTFNVFFVINIK